MAEGYHHKQAPGGLTDPTAREQEILRLIREGKNNAQIAEALGIARGTVKCHVEHIAQKLGIHPRRAGN